MARVRAPPAYGVDLYMYLERHHRFRRPHWSRRFASLLFAMLAAIDCGCGSAAASRKSIALSVLGLTPAAGAQLRRAALDDFTRNTGVEVDLVPTVGDSAEQLRLVRGLLQRHARTPDVYVMDVVWTGALRDQLLDLRPYLTPNLRDQLPVLLADDASPQISSLPFYLNVGMLYYRSDLLAKYGYAHPPRTWEELERMARAIQRGERAGGNSHFWGYVWQGSAYEGLTCNSLEWQSSFGGGRILEPDGTISVNNPRVRQALKKASSWIGSISPPSVLSYLESDSLNVFRSGNAAFLRYWSSGYDPMGPPGRGKHGQCAVSLLPAGPRGRAQTIGGFRLGVSPYSLHFREAVQLILYLCSREVQARRVRQGRYLPTLAPLYEDRDLLAAIPQMAVLKEAGAESWVARPSNVAGDKYAAVSREYSQTVHAILARTAAPDKALAALEKRLAELTGFKAGAAPK